MAACYGGARAVQKLEEEDPIEAAFDSAFANTKPVIPQHDDPLGLEEAFDQAFPNAGASDVEVESSESEVVAESDASQESRPGLAPSSCGSGIVSDRGSDDGDDADGSLAVVRRHVRRMRAIGSLRREGKVVFWGNKPIGNITAWGPNVSCHCRLHSKCKSPACRTWGSDKTLENWLLEGIDEDGELRVERDVHIRSITAIAVKMRQR